MDEEEDVEEELDEAVDEELDDDDDEEEEFRDEASAARRLPLAQRVMAPSMRLVNAARAFLLEEEELELELLDDEERVRPWW